MAGPKHQSVIIWEKNVYCQTPDKGWICAQPARMEDAVAVIQEHCKAKSRLMMLYDADVLQTEYTECPPGGRPIAREALSASHESIANMHTAWGIQQPWQLAGGGTNYGTFCSYETVPTLYSLAGTLRDMGYTIDRAFPLTTLASLAGGTPGRTQIFLVVDRASQAFVYIHTATGLRAARKLYAGKRQERYDVWNEISMVFGEYGVTFDDGGQRPQLRIYQAPGTDAKAECPYWNVLHEQAQTEVLGFDSLAAMLAAVPARHSSALMADMPRYIDFDFGVKVAASVLAAIFLGFGIYAYLDLAKDSKEIRILENQKSMLATQKRRLDSNKVEIENLKKLYSQGIFEASRGRVRLFDALPGAIPKEATLTEAHIGSGNNPENLDFRLEGVFWNWKTTASQRTSGRGAAASATPLTDIVKVLEGNIQGLLTAQSSTQIQPTGDFALQGTTPQPESHAATAKPAPAPARGGPRR